MGQGKLSQQVELLEKMRQFAKHIKICLYRESADPALAEFPMERIDDGKENPKRTTFQVVFVSGTPCCPICSHF